LILAASGASALLKAFPTLLPGMKGVGLPVIFYLAVKTMTRPPPDP